MARAGRYLDVDQYIRFVRRIIRAAGKRVADADPDQLRELLELHADLDVAIAAAVQGVRASGATWEDIGTATGTTRQAAFQKWATR